MRRDLVGVATAIVLTLVLFGLALVRRRRREREPDRGCARADLREPRSSPALILKLPEIDRAVLRSTAQCQKVGAPARETRGAGDWTCTILWSSPGQRIPLRDTYDPSVSPDGCYTATADGSEAHIGGPTLTARDGATITNLLYAFEGCFDTTGTPAAP